MSPHNRQALLGDNDSNSFPFLPPRLNEDQVWVPPSFRNAVLLHVVKNFTSHLNPPLILGIQGPMGEGKSFQTRAVCSELGFYVVPLSGASLSGSHEREAVTILERAYLFASSLCQEVNRMTVLLIDDFDLSVAATLEDRKYTGNSQLLAGFMMNLCDEPRRCGEKKPHRIPLITTGNNFSALYAPLTRHGRMDLFQWRPDVGDKVQIVATMLSPLLRAVETKGDLDAFINEYCSEPISFFAVLKQDLVNEAILDCVDRDQQVNIRSIQEAAHAAMSDLTILKLRGLAEKRKAMVTANYLQ